MTDTADVLVVGAGAAGLATAIAAGRSSPQLRVRCVDGARTIGAKILVSGGSRCNVTNRVVTERDFWGGSSRVVARVLRAFPSARAVEWFASLGVALHEEEDGKLFPDTNSSRTVLDALVREAAAAGVHIHAPARVEDIRRDAERFVVATSAGTFDSAAVVLATGGRSLPKSGSDGFGYELARRLGHGHVATTPALVPLVLASGPHASLSGVTHDAELSLRVDGRVAVTLEGALLWTHFGISGPVALNLSRHWHRARLDGRRVEVLMNLCPGETFEAIEAWLIEHAAVRPRARIATVLASRLPAAVADACLAACGVDRETTPAHLTREARRSIVRVLTAMPLDVTDSRGYRYAEVTAGGVPLEEIDPATMASRVCPGLYLAGEILDVDGRLGGFNFQWAWSSGWVAGRAIARDVQR
ncbi:MAG TPA: NAD(P)/FAD-dependent oxidoreductase [Vicinamibacterales bacterium]|nr:NAD(P)/FAD-dependent oxidoreductase [Vicinamibacterales bacterium]